MPVKYSKVLFVLTDFIRTILIIEIYDGYKFMNSRQCTGLIVYLHLAFAQVLTKEFQSKWKKSNYRCLKGLMDAESLNFL